MKSDGFMIGKIVNTHGIKGEVKVIPYTDSNDRFNDFDWVYVGTDTEKQKNKIESIRFHKNLVLIKFKDINNMNDAEKIKNKIIYIDREHAKKLPENTYFIKDLLDIKVYDEDNNFLGNIIDVFQTGSNDVYAVKNNQNGKQILLPAIKNVIKEVNIDKNYIKVSIIEGLDWI